MKFAFIFSAFITALWTGLFVANPSNSFFAGGAVFNFLLTIYLAMLSAKK